MRKILLALIVVAPVVLGQTAERQTRFSTPERIAFDYLASSSGIPPEGLSSVYLAKEYTTAHNGVTHLVYRQRFQGIDVQNAAWIANVGSDGVVLNTAGKFYPEPEIINFADQLPAATAVRSAVREVNPRLAAKYVPSAVSDTRYKVRYAAGEFGADIDGRLVWFAHRGTLLLAWLFNVVDEDGVTGYDVVVEAATGAIINKQPTTFFQNAPRGLVYDLGSPQPNPRPGERLTAPPPVVERSSVSFAGDLTASPMGWSINNE